MQKTNILALLMTTALLAFTSLGRMGGIKQGLAQVQGRLQATQDTVVNLSVGNLVSFEAAGSLGQYARH